LPNGISAFGVFLGVIKSLTCRRVVIRDEVVFAVEVIEKSKNLLNRIGCCRIRFDKIPFELFTKPGKLRRLVYL